MADFGSSYYRARQIATDHKGGGLESKDSPSVEHLRSFFILRRQVDAQDVTCLGRKLPNDALTRAVAAKLHQACFLASVQTFNRVMQSLFGILAIRRSQWI